MKRPNLFSGLYLTSKTVHKLEVDTSRGERITINVRYLADSKHRCCAEVVPSSFPEKVHLDVLKKCRAAVGHHLATNAMRLGERGCGRCIR